MVNQNKVRQPKEIALPPMKFVCELPKSTNTIANYNWTTPTLELRNLGPLIDKYLMTNPYVFQAEAIPKIIQGSDLLITSGTGSGKTEIFLLAILELLLQEKISGAIIFYPSKQLVQDQEKRLVKYLKWIDKELGKKITYSSYTGDLSTQAIAGIERACPDILLATFDKIFHRIVKDQKNSDNNHAVKISESKQQFFSHIISAKVVVFDEIHVYSGLMLSNIYNYIQIHKAVNPDCRIILSSATLSEVDVFRDAFLPTADIISGNPQRGPIQVLSVEKQYLEQLNNYIQKKFLDQKSSNKQPRRVLLFNDNISENEAFTYQIKQQMVETTGIEIQRITEQEQNKIACIHAQLSPERKHDITVKAQENQLLYLISTDLLAQGVDFPCFYTCIQIGWPITGLTGAIQRIGRLRFTEDLTETRYFIFVFDSNNEKDGFFLGNPKELAKRLLHAKLPPLLFTRENFRIIQGYILLAIAYGITQFDYLKSIYCKSITLKDTKHKINRMTRQAITFLISQGVLVISDSEISVGSYTELAIFTRNYSLRAIPPKWVVKNQKDKSFLFTIDSRKILKESLPGNLLLNDGCFWLVKDINQRQKEIIVELLDNQQVVDLSKMSRNKCFSPEFSFGRFAQELFLQTVKIQYGDLQVIRRPSIINTFNPTLGFTQIDLKNDDNSMSPLSKLTFSEQTTGLVITIPRASLAKLLKSLVYHQYHFLKLFVHVILLEATRELNISRKEIVSSISWSKGKEAIAIYDLAGPSGNSQKIFFHIEKLLRNIQKKLVNCSCSFGCNICFGDLTKLFKFNPKKFLINWLEMILN